MIARTDPKGPFMSNWTLAIPEVLHHLFDLVTYSLRPHGTALWKLNRSTGELDWMMDLPGCGDTAFPSIVPTSQTTFLILNYSSPMDKCANWPWIWGQLASEGTMIYAVTIAFEKNV